MEKKRRGGKIRLLERRRGIHKILKVLEKCVLTHSPRGQRGRDTLSEDEVVQEKGREVITEMGGIERSNYTGKEVD